MERGRTGRDISDKTLVVLAIAGLAGLGFCLLQRGSIPWPNPARALSARIIASSSGDDPVQEDLERQASSLDSSLARLEAELDKPVGRPRARVVPAAVQAQTAEARVSSPVAEPDKPPRPKASPEHTGESGLPALKRFFPLSSNMIADAGGTKAGQLPPPTPEVPLIQDPCLERSGDQCTTYAMDHFWDSLSQVGEGRKVRVAVLGDSLIMGDYIVGDLRRLLQHRFGGSGPGLVFPTRVCNWYSVSGVDLEGDKDWKIFRITKPRIEDDIYGLGHHTFLCRGGKCTTSITSSGKEPWDHVSEYGVFYLAQPEGGEFLLRSGSVEQRIDAKSEGIEDRYQAMEVPEGPLNLELETISGQNRVFGLVAEHSGGGVVVDLIPTLGARSSRLNNNNPEHWGRQLKLRNYDLVILMFGANESTGDRMNRRDYTERFIQALRTIRTALPQASVLVLSPLGNGVREEGRIKVNPLIPTIVEMHREAAGATGCAFWSAYEAMGGAQGPSRWFKNRPRLLSGDMIHLTSRGGERMGKMLYAALLYGFGTRK